MKTKTSSLMYALIMGLFVFANSCKEENIPVLTTIEVSEITDTTAKSGGIITPDAGSTITSRGVCWSTNQTPTIADNKTKDGIGAVGFISNITGLTPGTTYYVRAYATNRSVTGYGNSMSFTTKGFTTGTVKDIDGNVYHTVTIGTQVWMGENLKTTKYRDGTSIPNITSVTAWSELTTGAYSDYDNTPPNSATYGRLYNWYAVTDGHNIAPAGWHVPTDAEWKTLTTYLGGAFIAGGKLKETGTTHWTIPNTDATNEVGFTALPGGKRSGNGSFYNIGCDSYWWSTTEYGATVAWDRCISYFSSDVYNYSEGKVLGFSVRCVKD